MRRSRPLQSKTGPGVVRGVASAAPRATPLTMVSAAVAGDDLHGVAGSASEALGCPVAIALPAFGPPVVWPADANASASAQALAEHAEALIRGDASEQPPGVSELVPVRIGPEVIGVVAALGDAPPPPERRA